MAEIKEHPRLGKATKTLAITASILVMLPCLALATFGILDLAGVFPYLEDQPRFYTVTFISDNKTFDTKTIKRGEYLIYGAEPYKLGYTFKGWDTDGNKIANNIHIRVYSNIKAVALWSKK